LGGAIRAAGSLDGDLGEAVRAFLGGGGGGSGGGGRLVQAVDGLHHEENRQAHDDEVDDGVDEHAVIDGGRPGLLGRRQAGVGRAAQVDEQVAEVDLAQQQADGGHDDVLDQRVDHCPEGCADDDAHGQVDYAAAHDEFLKFLPHGNLL
jgi:hypothetical protein